MKPFKILRIASAAALALMLAHGAGAVELRMGGGSIPFKAQLPEGWCAFDNEAKADRAFAAYLSKAAGRSIRVLGITAPCRELADFRKNGRRIPERFAAIAQVGVDGGFGRFLMGRAVYNALITSFTPSDMSRTEKRATKRLSEYGDSVSSIRVKILGTAAKASWFEGEGVITHEGGASETLRLAGGSTLVSKYPVAAFYVTAGSGSLDEALRSIAMPLLKGVDSAR